MVATLSLLGSTKTFPNAWGMNSGAVDPQTIGSQCLYIPSTNKLWCFLNAFDPFFSTNGGGWICHVRVCDLTKYNAGDNTAWSDVYVAAQSGFMVDSHIYSAPFVDANGRVHVMFAHGAMQHSMTTNPDDPTSWSQQPQLTGSYASMIYPQVLVIGSTAYLFSGQNSDNEISLVIGTIASDGTISWGPRNTIISYASINLSYISSIFVHPTTGKFHFTGCYQVNATNIRANVYYYIFDPVTLSISNIDGSVTTPVGSQPIVDSVNTASYLLIDQTGHGGSISQICFDTNGVLHLVYADSTGISSGALSAHTGIYHTTYVGGVLTTPDFLGQANTPLEGMAPVPNADGSVDVYWIKQNSQIYTGSSCGGDMYCSRWRTGVMESPTLISPGGKTFGLLQTFPVRSSTPQVLVPPQVQVSWAESSVTKQGNTPTAYPSGVWSWPLRWWVWGGTTGFLQSTSPNYAIPSVTFCQTLIGGGQTLSANLLSVTDPSGIGGAVGATHPVYAGLKNYAEVTIGTFTNNITIGAFGATFNASGTLGNDVAGKSIGVLIDTGAVRKGNAILATVAGLAGTTADVYGMAISRPLAKIWFSKNNVFDGDPVAGTGGYDITSLLTSLNPRFAVSVLRAGDQVTAKFATPFTFTAPSGYSAIVPGSTKPPGGP